MQIEWRKLMQLQWCLYYQLYVCPRPPSIVFHIETILLIYSVKQKTGFCIKCNIRQKWVSLVVFLLALNLSDLWK